MSGQLSGATILVTRPRPRGETMLTSIEEAGGRVCLFPGLRIEATQPDKTTLAQLEHAAGFDFVIFISPNAVEYAAGYLDVAGLQNSKARIAALGNGTAGALQQIGLGAALKPEKRATSESLLELPAFGQVEHARILIVRGRGGRELLADTLRSRGAQITYAEVYCRLPPADDPVLLNKWLCCNELDAAVFTSTEAFHNISSLLGPQARHFFVRLQLVVTSSRMIQMALDAGIITPPLLADDPGDQAIVQSLVEWWQARR